jgi:hypothetical protein
MGIEGLGSSPPEEAGCFVFDTRYVEALAHAPRHRVLGRRLRPFCLWHRLQLEYANSPLLTGAPTTLADLEYAVAVCRTRFGELGVARPPVGCWRRWAAYIRQAWWNVELERAKWTAYAMDYASSPKMMMSRGGSAGESVPDMDEALVEVAMYRRMTGCSREEPWEMPMGEVAWMNAAFARQKGAKFSIITPLDDEIVEEIKKNAETLKAEKLTGAAVVDARGGDDGANT